VTCTTSAHTPIDHPDKKWNPTSSPISGKAKRSLVVKDLQSGRSPFDILESMTEWSPPEFWAVVDYLRAHGLIAETLQVFPSPIMYQTHESNLPYLLNFSCFLLRISNVATVMFVFSSEAEICVDFIWFKLWNMKV
jgi:hypothetical protein